jgi:predicted O-methyltransferase YrrM
MMINFDKKTEEVLDHYHKRMEEEDVLFKTVPEKELFSRVNEFLLPVGKDAALFLNTLIKSAKSKIILELGTSYGYSTLWLAEAARAVNGRVITMELSAEKSAYAENKINEAGLSEYVDFRTGDAVQLIKEATENFDFVLVDLWKELYTSCLNEFCTKLNSGAWVVADNIISPPHHTEEIDRYRKRIKELNLFDTILLPIGSGLEVSQFKKK